MDSKTWYVNIPSKTHFYCITCYSEQEAIDIAKKHPAAWVTSEEGIYGHQTTKRNSQKNSGT